MSHREKGTFGLDHFAIPLSICVFIYIFLRALFVPVSHDEAATFFHYIHQGEFLPFQAHWDANNHMLNSALGILFYKAFGSDLIWLRMPNVLSFLVYAFFVWKVLGSLKSAGIRIITFAALITAWLPLEFFAQCRGYGISLALLFGGIYFLTRYIRNPSPLLIASCSLFLGLAMSANLSLNNTYLAILAFIFCLIFILKPKWRAIHFSIWFICGVIPYLGLAWISFEMKNRDLLYYGEGDGILKVTLNTLSLYSFNYKSIALSIALAGMGILASSYLLVANAKRRVNQWNGGLLSAYLLLANVAGALGLHYFFGVNYPEDRTGIYFIPYFILVIGFSVGELQNRNKHLKWIALGLIIFPLVTIAHFNFKEVRLWNTLPVSSEIYEKVLAKSNNFDRPPIIGGYKLYTLSWGYHNIRFNGALPPLVERNVSDEICDFQICHSQECDPYRPDFNEIWQNGDMHLLQRKEKLSFEALLVDQSEKLITGSESYYNFIDVSSDSLLQPGAAIELDFTFSSGELSPKFDVVIVARDSIETVLEYNFVSIKWIRSRWDENRLHFIRPIKLPENTSRVICYLWNIENQPFEMKVHKTAFLRHRKNA